MTNWPFPNILWQIKVYYDLFNHLGSYIITHIMQQLLPCLNFTLHSEDLAQMKKVISVKLKTQIAENHGDALIWYFWQGLYTSIPTQTYSENSLAAAEALSLKISSHGRVQLNFLKHCIKSFVNDLSLSIFLLGAEGRKVLLWKSVPDHRTLHFQ